MLVTIGIVVEIWQPCTVRPNIGALIIRIGFWGPLYYFKETPKIVLLIIWAPII